MNIFLDNIEQNNKRSKEILLHENFKNGNIKVVFASISDKSTNKELLVRLKLLFQKQLSKMPREYILRQVFDHKNICLMLTNNSNGVIAGICYRPFYDRGFYEIVFCAVDNNYQVKGIGSFMMDVLKQQAKLAFSQYYKALQDRSNNDNPENRSLCNHFTNIVVDQLDCLKNPDIEFVRNIYLITYADNFAVGYFKKQGFRKNITFNTWIGYIKDYEGGTIMECNIFWEIDYINKHLKLSTVRDEFIDKTKKSTNYYQTYKIDKINPKSIPGINTNMHIHPDRRNKENCLVGFIELIIGILQNNPSSWPFAAPVSPKDVPEYYEVIKSPMDISTIKNKHRKNMYTNIDLFISDVHLMLNNCFKFNGRDTQYYKCAEELFDKFEETLEFYKEFISFLKLKN